MSLPRALVVVPVLVLACSGDPDTGSQLSGGTGSSASPDATATGVGSSGNASASTDADADADSGSEDGMGPKLDVASATGGVVDECGEDDDNPIYLLKRGVERGEPASIVSFDPETLAFTPVQDVVCPDTEADWLVSTMAVDRNRRAWVLWVGEFVGGDDVVTRRLDAINLDTGECETAVGEFPITMHASSPMGMAFVSDAEGSNSEALFFADHGTYLYGLGDTEPVARWYDGPEGRTFSGVELTGTGAGSIFTIIMNYTGPFDHDCTAKNPCFPTVRVAETMKVGQPGMFGFDPPGVESFALDPGGFAFAHWGGHFFIFLSRFFGPTLVYDYDPVAQTAELVVDDGPDAILGAGVSTCAPLVFPEG